MKVRGTIYLHHNLVYHDGAIGNKYLILLNTPREKDPFLLVKTTSQKKNKPSTPGCICSMSLFFIPGKKTFFPLDTWVQLYEIYPIEGKGIRNNPNIRKVGELDAKITADIINCLFEAEEENIPQWFSELLRPTLEISLLKLQEKFNKK